MTPAKESPATGLRGKHLLYFTLAQLLLSFLQQISPFYKAPDTNEKVTELTVEVRELRKDLNSYQLLKYRIDQIEKEVSENSKTCDTRNTNAQAELTYLKENYIFPLLKKY